MFGLDESIKLERRSNDLLAIGELLVDMISNEYGDHAGSDGYTRFLEERLPTLPLTSSG